MHPVLGEPTFFSFISDDFGSSIGFGMSIILAGLIGFHARVRKELEVDCDYCEISYSLCAANGGAYFGRRGR